MQEASPACRLCGALEETNDHILECPYPCQQKLGNKVEDYLWRDNENHGNSELNNIIEIALSECTHNNRWTPDMSAISPDLMSCIQHQNKIGWYHLYKGRIAKGMIYFMEKHFQNLSVDSKRYTGERWGKMLICNLWNTMLQVWQQRNDIIHGNQDQVEHNAEKLRMEHRVKEYYNMQDTLDAFDQEKVHQSMVKGSKTDFYSGKEKQRGTTK
jgi:hypothetical protein